MFFLNLNVLVCEISTNTFLVAYGFVKLNCRNNLLKEITLNTKGFYDTWLFAFSKDHIIFAWVCPQALLSLTTLSPLNSHQSSVRFVKWYVTTFYPRAGKAKNAPRRNNNCSSYYEDSSPFLDKLYCFQ